MSDTRLRMDDQIGSDESIKEFPFLFNMMSMGIHLTSLLTRTR